MLAGAYFSAEVLPNQQPRAQQSHVRLDHPATDPDYPGVAGYLMTSCEGKTASGFLGIIACYLV